MSFVAISEPVITDRARQQLRTDVSLAAGAVALNWPIRTFISRSPLAGFEHLPFHKAVARARSLLGGEGYLSLAEYRACWARGRIGQDDLELAIKEFGPPTILESSLPVGPRRIRADEVLLLHLIHDIDPIDAQGFSWKIRNEEALTRFQQDLPAVARRQLLAGLDGVQSESRTLTALWEAIVAQLALPSNHVRGNLSSLHQPNEPPLQTVAELVDHLTGSTILLTVNDEIIKWLASFTDEGLGDWAMPSRDLGFYQAWRSLAWHDASGWFLGIKGFAKKVQALPDRAEDTLFHLLHRLGVPDQERIEYCSRHLAHLHGWSGYVRWRGQETDQPYPIDPIQYLAVRLFYEAELATAICLTSHDLQATLPRLRYQLLRQTSDSGAPHRTTPTTVSDHQPGEVWRLFVLAQHLGLTATDIGMLGGVNARTLLQWLDSMPTETHRPVWQEAYEHRYRRDLLSRLHPPRSGADSDSLQSRPLAQAVFCIDVRSEPFRRHLEAQGAYETIGFAGFFAIPLSYRGLHYEDDLSLCPVLIKPKVSVRETPRFDRPVSSEAHLRGTYWHEIGKHLFHRLKANPLSSYMLIDLTGVLFAFALAGKTVFLSLYQRMTTWVHQWLIPPVPTMIPVEQQGPTLPRVHHSLGETRLPHGFGEHEQAIVTENSLRVMGLTKNFARLVLLCGHGSVTENNPYASAYDCGACGGNHGGPNARVLARLANNQATRAVLRERGIIIPNDTLFLAAEHNTTTDRVTFFDLEDLPSSHRQDWERLAKDLARAGALAAAERCTRIPGAFPFATLDLASAHVEARSLDWAQTRPEWGLSGNAAFIIGRRAMTHGVNLNGRVFLHNYDAAADESGKALETIMTAPLVVAEWINLQYYFSSVDSWTYGSGSKVLHNVVGGVGVMLGRQSDLQTGLPIQSLKDGTRLYHEPMRLLAIIEATTDLLTQIIGRHQVLQQFFDHQWVHLLAMNPVTGNLQEYRPGGQWCPVTVLASREETQ